jgi:hypothetical protein
MFTFSSPSVTVEDVHASCVANYTGDPDTCNAAIDTATDAPSLAPSMASTASDLIVRGDVAIIGFNSGKFVNV